ncbi:MAG: hypothetical protein KKE62_06310 [Proteobacteria bacterium]|nr:hypothetical protein [Pseudomonadota bacterium]MBU1542442.1 hypothetical protein [Pseudomonadota bacterium]
MKDYIIAEYDRFMYTWEMNMALGQHRIGNCFIVGNILIMEPWSHEKEGCLKLEYYERLKKLPIWNQSQYYCFSPSLRNTGTKQSLSNYFNQLQTNKNKIIIEPVKAFEPKNFRIARYKIVVDENGTVSWQVYEQLNKIKKGLCIMESGILFISSQNSEVYENQSKKEWITKLRLLPKWDKTFAWGHWNILRACTQEKKTKKYSSLPWDSGRQGERIEKYLPSQTSLYDTAKLKDLWNRYAPLIINRVQFGARIFLYFLKKIVSWAYKMKDYFLKRIKK